MVKGSPNSIKYIFQRQFLSEAFVLLGSQIFIFAAIILVVSAIFFFLNISMNIVVLPLSAIASLFVIYWLNRKKLKQYSIYQILFLCIFTVLTYVISFLIATHFYDISYDGQEYHQGAILAMSNGWNPFLGDPIKPGFMTIWVQHYAKASETMAASLVVITHLVESGKVFNLLFIGATFYLSFGILLRFEKIRFYIAGVLSVLIALNPVSFYQSLSYYIDGQLTSCLIGFLLVGYLLISEKNNSTIAVWMALIVIMINLKFTGIAFAGIACIAVLILLLMKKDLITFKKSFIFFLITGILSICFVGFNPYVKNTLEFKTPFYPLSGENPIEIMDFNTPEELLKLSSKEKFLVSTFYMNREGKEFTLRIPFTSSELQLETYKSTDSRIGGFGIFFMEICVITFLLFLELSTKRDKGYYFMLFSIAVCLFIPLIFYKQAWWARYVPSLFFVPWIVLAYAYIAGRKSFFAHILLFIMLINSYIISVYYIEVNKLGTSQISQTISQLKESKEPIKIHFTDVGSRNNIRRFEENQIRYEIIEDSSLWPEISGKETTFFSSNIRIKY